MDQRTKKTGLYKKSVVVKSSSIQTRLSPANLGQTRLDQKRLAITTGDPKGVGFFITQQSLKKLGPKKNFQFIVWSNRQSPTLKIPPFKTLVFKKEALAFKSKFREDHLLQIKTGGGVGTCLQQAGAKALSGEVSALITCPVNKSSLKKYQIRGEVVREVKGPVVGQTDLLKKLSKSRHGFMSFRGSKFNVILLTDHCALKDVAIKKSQLKAVLSLALEARKFLPLGQQKKPLGVLGLNPHAGELGLLGLEEEKTLKPLIKNSKEVEGPLSPDSAFLKKKLEEIQFFYRSLP